MAKRLAITIAGAVSLGSYEGGVMYEILEAIGQHNLNPATAPADRITIDVLTGASAGGMTATIAAQKLLYEGSSLRSPYNNNLYLPWVADVDISGLLAYQPGDDPSMSILSSQYVVDISTRYLRSRYQSHLNPPAADPHPAAAREIALGLAMSNLNGVDYSVPTRPTGKFTYTRHVDQLTPANPLGPTTDTLADWNALAVAAVACGAFPFAFRVQDVIRHGIEYPGSDPAVMPTQPFAYTDGGVFQNEPLGLAKDLVDGIDQHVGTDDRYYLFVSHGGVSSTANATFNASKAQFLPTGVRIAESVLDQARFHDWIMAETVNAKIETFNVQAMQLQSLLVRAGAGANAIANSLTAAATQITPALFPANRPETETSAAAAARLRIQFATALGALPAPVGDAWISVIMLLERAAGIGDKDEMAIYSVTADRSELAGCELSSFAGFFDRRFRDHDYDVGRRKAQQFLLNPGALGPINYSPTPIHPIDSSLDGLTLDRMDRDLRQRVYDGLRKQAGQILEASGVEWLVREGLEKLLIPAILKRVLKL